MACSFNGPTEHFHKGLCELLGCIMENNNNNTTNYNRFPAVGGILNTNSNNRLIKNNNKTTHMFLIWLLTKVCDPDGHSFIDNVEYHDYNKADDGGCDRGGHLWSHILLERFKLLQVCPESCRK